jgi:hypothetical protein
MDSQHIFRTSSNKALQALMRYKYNSFNQSKSQVEILLNMALITLAIFLITLFIGIGNTATAGILEAAVFIFLIRKIKL